MKNLRNLALNVFFTIAIIISIFLSIIPFYILGVYNNCLLELLDLLHITLTSLSWELAKNFFIEIWSYLLRSNNVKEIFCDLIDFFLSIIQLIFWLLYLALDEFKLKITNKSIDLNLDYIDNEEINLIDSLNLKCKKGSNDQPPVTSQSVKDQDSDLEDNDPVTSKTVKGKNRANFQEENLYLPSSDKSLSNPIVIDDELDEDGHYSVYSPSEYSIIDTNTINSDDEQPVIEKKLALQELDLKLQQEARDQDIANELQNELNLEEEQSLDNTDWIFRVEKTTSKLDKQIDRLNYYFPSETGEASSSSTIDESTTKKDSEKKKTKK